MSVKPTNLRQVTNSVSSEWVSFLRSRCNNMIARLKYKKLILTGGIDGEAVIIDTVEPDKIVSMIVTVKPTDHIHTKEQLPVSVPAVGDTIALRDNSGNIFSNSSSSTNTGYKMQNGADIATLFKKTGTKPFTIKHNRITTTNYAVCIDATLTKSGSQLILDTHWSNYCSYYYWCRCQCCC